MEPPRPFRREPPSWLVFAACAFVATVAFMILLLLLAPDDTDRSPPTLPPIIVPTAPAYRSVPDPLGTRVEVAQGWYVRVITADADATAELAALNVYNHPSAGHQLVSVTVEIVNRGHLGGTVGGNMRLLLVTGTGAVLMPAVVTDAHQLNGSQQLAPGETVEGLLAFEVPSTDTTGMMLLAEAFLTSDKTSAPRLLALT